uniref:Uncharacterized protein n=1 Tax=Arundo donax TaxID=35708 RepID=A0A0A9DBQ9_ARUDO
MLIRYHFLPSSEFLVPECTAPFDPSGTFMMEIRATLDPAFTWLRKFGTYDIIRL